MARRRGVGRGAGLRAILLVLLLLAGAFVMERLDLLPDGTVERILGLEEPREEPPRQPPGRQAPSGQARTPPQAERLDYAEVDALLGGIRVEPENRRSYQREDWPHWIDLDGDCQDTRDEVLIAESLDPPRLSPDGCKVVSGRWLDPYTGETLGNPRDLDIDHRIPLQEAHNSGGAAWDRERRAAFANDLADARTLVAVLAAANRAKGAKGPEEWLPPDRANLCLYVADWVAVKARWQLSMDERERVTIGNLLADCRAQVAERP